MIKVKPIVKDHFWIIRDGERKIGEVSQDSIGLNVRIADQSTYIKTISNLRENFGVEIDDSVDVSITDKTLTDVHNYPAEGNINEPMWDIQNRLPLYTKNDNSKSLYAAGWYSVTIKKKNKIMFCPKLIILQRNDYAGPFKEEPAENKFANFFE